MSSPSLHLSVVVHRPPAEVYAVAADPANLPRWAAGLARGVEQVDDTTWAADSPMGRVLVAFTPPNDLGVLDHVVTLPDGTRTHNPLRVLPLGDHTEVVFTLRRAPGADDAAHSADAALVQADLERLKGLVEGG
ncbi:MAG: polyketide cyclase/dehydrase [Frankiales bacterium]|nr:polyketide cyclase/dehydrase [Frankiales bacterium]